MTIFTVYFCGTSSTKYDDSKSTYWNGELVSTLAKNNLGKEFAEWIIIDGPGSGNLQADELFTEPGGYYKMTGVAFGLGWVENVKHATNIMKGKFDWQRETLTEENYKQLKNAGIPIDDVETKGSWFWRKYNYGSRHVTQQQLQEQIIKQFRKDGVIPTQVNLIGWSRGGISCTMLANAMWEDSDLKNIPVNIFAIDPVPGALNFQGDKVKLGGNVKEYVAIYARDERSLGFNCAVPDTDSATKIHIYPMAGRHATLVGNAATNGVSGAKVFFEPGDIVRHYAETCLTRWGVSLDKKLMLTKAQLDQRLATIKRSYDTYTTMRTQSYLGVCTDVQGEREIYYDGKHTNFTAAHAPRFSPDKGLSTGHILSSDYFNDII
ncbi:hypothetical protein [Pseudomonas lurida]|uniref:hypothetical protein n=1 Tax=Pseudomonas lurida TaxID=244566 RepID=UPI001F43D0E4|nr:hypothetical protein [Pseudomonas lurida]MCF5023108.1 hypothetical protein [Pseudomonas lurida]MCF5306899.1 hypothetical protein [Pseudomonas lurida]MCF5327615.1 hypothetical protein [Pseudomonas lurida]